MEGSDVTSVESVGTEEAIVATPTAETVDAPVGESEEDPVQEPAPVGDDAEPKARVNESIAVDAPVQQSAQAPESAEAPAPVPENVHEKENGEEMPVEMPASPRGVKRRASRPLSTDTAEFHGFEADDTSLNDSARRCSVLDKMAAEVAAEEAALTPVRRVAVPRNLKRQRTDDGSRSSSSLSHRSDGDTFSSDLGAGSPAGGRRRTDALSSPLFRIPLERGWKRELVYRAVMSGALDTHGRRNADIYYYTPAGKKLRSSREVSDHLGGTGLTLDHFTFFKEPLGLDDPDKEIIRDAKPRDSPQSSPAPVAAAAVEGKRTPKPKPPKGASPEPKPTVAPLKLKVKSMGSRLSGTGRNSTGGDKTSSSPTTNNNSSGAAWKKPRLLVPPPPPLLCRPTLPEPQPVQQGEPCSMRCAAAPGQVPSLACTVCLCLYHPACARHTGAGNFLCKNCRVTTGPPPLTHKSGSITPPPQPPPPLTPAPNIISLRASAPPPRGVGIRRYPAPRPVPIRRINLQRAPALPTPHRLPVRFTPPMVATPPAAAPPRVYLRMKAQGGGGERVWAVQPMPGAPPPILTPAPTPGASTPSAQAAQTPSAPTPSVSTPTASTQTTKAKSVPQAVAFINGRKFILVPKNPAAAAYTHTPATANGDAIGAARRRGRPAHPVDLFTPFYYRSHERDYNVVVQVGLEKIFQYLGMRDLARCARVCRLWRTFAATPVLWRHVRMKNSQVNDWRGLCAALSRHGTKRLDLRKMLLPQNDDNFWLQFAENISTVHSLERLELCRCPASAVEAVCRGLSGLKQLGALAVRDARLDPAPIAQLTHLCDLRIKSMSGLTLTSDLTPLVNLKNLQHLSLTSIKELGGAMCGVVVGSLRGLVSLELGECTFGAEFGLVLRRLAALQRLRLERGTADCDAPALLRALSTLPALKQLELVNFDVKPGFDDALALCQNIQRLLIIPTYVSQSATTNRQVLSGVIQLKDTLTHLMWGVTIELLRVTELFIDQCEGGSRRSPLDGHSIPVLKPVPGYSALSDPQQRHSGPPQVEILPLPTLQSLLTLSLPNTRLKLLKIPFHATWRQSLADFN